MASLWVPSGVSEVDWAAVDLGAEGFPRGEPGSGGEEASAPALLLTTTVPHVTVAVAAQTLSPEPSLTWRSSGADGALLDRGRRGSWVLLDGQHHRVRVNGLPLLTGLRVLADRDELTFENHPGLRMVFTTERPAKLEEIAGSPAIKCARCRRPTATGTGNAASAQPVTIVRCPGCGAIHHQHDQSPCWTGFTDEPFVSCAVCDFPATLDGRFRWMPD